MIHPDGTEEARDVGTPQGGVISPLLANLFLHYAFDKWMERNYSQLTSCATVQARNKLANFGKF